MLRDSSNEMHIFVSSLGSAHDNPRNMIKIHCTVKKNDLMYCNFEKKKLAFKVTYIDKELAK